jgi:hypothetical protein
LVGQQGKCQTKGEIGVIARAFTLLRVANCGGANIEEVLALVSVLEQRLLDGVAPSALEQRLIDAVGPSDFIIYEGHLTKPQMARAMGRNTRTLDNWHRNHVGPPRIKFGGVILYNIEAAKQWLAAQSLPHGERAKPPGQSYFLAKQQQKRGPGRPRKQPPTAAAE